MTLLLHPVILLGLHVHTTHILQPLEVGIFMPVKNTTATAFQLGLDLTGWKLACNTAINAFRRSGLYPFDPPAIDETKKRKRKLVFG